MMAARTIPKIIWIHTVIIMTFGLLCLYSASFNNNGIGQGVFYDQLFCAFLGLFVMVWLSCSDYRKFFDVSYIMYAISVVFLVMVLWMGHHAMGATRWFSVGNFSFQPSEFSKLAVIFFLGRYFSERRKNLMLADGLWALGVVAFSMLLIFKQPDLGTAILLLGIFLVMLYTSGMAHRLFFVLLGVLVLSLPFAWGVLKPYQKDRLLVFLNPSLDPLGAGYTITQSKIAVGSGQLWGKGYLAGTQNQLNFLPERHTDFIFSVMGEEWGFLGAMVLIYCYGMIMYCGFKIIRHNKDPFGQLVAVGIITILAMQVIINIGMAMGLLPVVGITLPFMSYGRSSFMVFAVMFGFLLSLAKKRTVF